MIRLAFIVLSLSLFSPAELPIKGVDLTAPDRLPDKPSEIRAVAMWMACSNECYPGNKTFTLFLPSAESSVTDPIHRDAFSAAEKQIPQALKNWNATSLPFVLVVEKPLSPEGPRFGTLEPSYPDHSPDENDQTP